MLLKWWLCLLYMLQVVVTLGMIAGYIYDVSSAKPSSSQSRFQAALFELASDAHDREKIPRSKPSVKMKAIPLSYLKDKIPKVTSRSDFLRLFTNSGTNDHLPNHRMSRKIRSFPWSLGYEKPILLQSKDALTPESGSAFEPSRISTQKSESFQEHVAAEVKEVKNVVSPLEESAVADRVVDADYYVDYPQDGDVQDDPVQDNLEAFEAALHHIDETNNSPTFKCRHPTPYVHRVTDPHDPTRLFLPECVLLHRCMNFTGCCGTGSECVPKRMNIVTMAFIMIDRLTELDDHVIFNPKMATTLEFVNHTECECREKQQLPKCTKGCPSSFRLTQEGKSCKCDCFPLANQDSWPCQSVKDGLVPLSLDALLSIKNGNCYMPACTMGEFDTKTGFCPLTDDYAIPASFFQHPDDRRLYREHLSSLDLSIPLTKYTHSLREDETGSRTHSLRDDETGSRIHSLRDDETGSRNHSLRDDETGSRTRSLRDDKTGSRTHSLRDDETDSRTHSLRDDETGSPSTETASEVLKTSISTTEEININSFSQKSKFTPETKLIYSAVDTQLVSSNSVSFSQNKGTFSVEGEDITSSSSLLSSDKPIHMTNNAPSPDKSADDKGNNVNLTVRDDIPLENITSSLNQTDSSSSMLAKENGNSAGIEKTGTTPAYTIFGTRTLNEAVNSKLIRSNTEPTPDIMKKAVPTLSLLGYGSPYIFSAVPENNFQASDNEEQISDEGLDSNLLKTQISDDVGEGLDSNQLKKTNL